MAQLSKRAVKFTTYLVLAMVAFVVSFFVSGSRYGQLSNDTSPTGAQYAHADAPPPPPPTGGSAGSDGGNSGGGGGDGSGGDGCGGSGCGSGGDSGSGSGGDSGGGSDCL